MVMGAGETRMSSIYKVYIGGQWEDAYRSDLQNAKHVCPIGEKMTANT